MQNKKKKELQDLLLSGKLGFLNTGNISGTTLYLKNWEKVANAVVKYY